MALTIPNTFVNGTPAVATQVNANFTAVKTEVDLKVDSTLVDAKGDLIVATAADTVARQAVGSNGQVLVADSGQTNGVAWVDPLSNRNVVINGAMQVTQRSAVGTAVTGITTEEYYTADRFRTLLSTLGTWSQTTAADAPTGSGFRNSFKMACTTANASPSAGNYHIIQHRIEGQNLQQFLKGTASAKSFALSFWVKSFQTGTFIAELEDVDNSRSVSASYSISASATWEKKTIIFPADTTGAFDNDNAQSLSLNFWLGAGSTFTSGTLATTWGSRTSANRAVGGTNVASSTNNYWQITGVQLEAGSVATPFEFEDIGVTLAKCQRYYQRITNNATNSYTGLFGAAYSTTGGAFFYGTKTSMRVKPTSVDFSNLRIYDLVGVQAAITAIVLSEGSTDGFTIDCTTSTMTQYRTYAIIGGASLAGYLGFSAEL
jgi:hypothetical protein